MSEIWIDEVLIFCTSSVDNFFIECRMDMCNTVLGYPIYGLPCGFRVTRAFWPFSTSCIGNLRKPTPHFRRVQT